MSSTRTAAEVRFDEHEAAILAEYNAVCDKARAAADAAIDRIMAEGADPVLTQRRIDVAVKQLVITQQNADKVRMAAIRRNNEQYDRAVQA